MSVRKFLLPVCSSASAAGALHLGLMLARMWHAHLEVLHIRADTREIAPFAGEGLSGAMIEDMMHATERQDQQRAQSLRALFDAAVEEAGMKAGHALPGNDEPSASF